MPAPRPPRRAFLRQLGLGAAALLVGSRLRAADSRKPNIVFILADDLGWADLGCQGSRYYETPHIDRIAREGMRFTNAYANGPNCAPTRASLMSGQYTPRHGIFTVGDPVRGPLSKRKLIPPKNNTTLAAGHITLAEALHAGGYRTGHFGKWHLGAPPEAGPKAQGFDVNAGGTHAGHPPTYFSPYRINTLSDGPKGEYLTDRLTDEALKFIEDSKGGPFFLYLPHFAVHTPIQSRKDKADHYKSKPAVGGQANATYAGMIASVDEGVGRILDKLDELKLARNTLVIFFSDNGGVGGYRKEGIQGKDITSNAPLRGGKGMLYEGGIREPLLIRWPTVVKAGTECAEPVIGIDFYPTLCELAGVEPPATQTLDGVSIAPLLRGKQSLGRQALYWHFPCYLQGGGGTLRTSPVGVVRKGRHKLLEFLEDRRLELYDLDADIGETRDLAEAMPDKTRELHALLVAWREAVKAPMPKPNPGYDPNARPSKHQRGKKA